MHETRHWGGHVAVTMVTCLLAALLSGCSGHSSQSGHASQHRRTAAPQPPLSGDVQVASQVLNDSDPDSEWTVGETFTDTWTFVSSCVRSCSISVSGTLDNGPQFSIPLNPKGNGYTGSGMAGVTTCFVTTSEPPDTLTLDLTSAKNGVRNGVWRSWSGTLIVSAPVAIRTERNLPKLVI